MLAAHNSQHSMSLSRSGGWRSHQVGQSACVREQHSLRLCLCVRLWPLVWEQTNKRTLCDDRARAKSSMDWFCGQVCLQLVSGRCWDSASTQTAHAKHNRCTQHVPPPNTQPNPTHNQAKLSTALSQRRGATWQFWQQQCTAGSTAACECWM